MSVGQKVNTLLLVVEFKWKETAPKRALKDTHSSCLCVWVKLTPSQTPAPLSGFLFSRVPDAPDFSLEPLLPWLTLEGEKTIYIKF